jgi:hypothetical protein
MVPAGALLAVGSGTLAVGIVLLGAFLVGFEFAIVSALPIVANMVPGAPGRGLGLGMAGATLGRATMAITATALYEAHGIGAPGLLAAFWAALAVTAVTAYRRTVSAGSPSSVQPAAG